MHKNIKKIIENLSEDEIATVKNLIFKRAEDLERQRVQKLLNEMAIKKEKENQKFWSKISKEKKAELKSKMRLIIDWKLTKEYTCKIDFLIEYDPEERICFLSDQSPNINNIVENIYYNFDVSKIKCPEAESLQQELKKIFNRKANTAWDKLINEIYQDDENIKEIL